MSYSFKGKCNKYHFIGIMKETLSNVICVKND